MPMRCRRRSLRLIALRRCRFLPCAVVATATIFLPHAAVAIIPSFRPHARAARSILSCATNAATSSRTATAGPMAQVASTDWCCCAGICWRQMEKREEERVSVEFAAMGISRACFCLPKSAWAAVDQSCHR